MEENGIFILPDDYAYYVALYFNTNEVDLVDKSDLGSIINSYGGSPTISFPIATINNKGVKILPSDIDENVFLHYYKYPQGIDANGNPIAQSPTYATITVNDTAVFDASNSIDFELGQAAEYKLAVEILSYIGLNLREQELMQWGMMKQQEQDQKAN